MGKFFGTYHRTLDEKNRLQVPSKLLDDLPSKFYLLRGFEGCLDIYLQKDFDALMESLSALSYLDKNARDYIRLTTASTMELPTDSHGRLALPKDVVDSYHIGKDVLVLGVIDHFEIWDDEAYAAYEAKNAPQYAALASSLGKGE